MSTSRSLTSFSCLTFDCFGTLVDWEGGVYEALLPLRQQLPASHPLYNDRLGTLRAFTEYEVAEQRAHPAELYSNVLAAAYGNLAAELGLQASEDEKAKFGASVGDWPAFPDTVDALKRLHKHYKLVILSNVDKASFSQTLTKQLGGIDFDAIYTAEEIGSYKPDLRNFQFLIEHCDTDLGVKKADILHTAQSLFHDHAPAKQIGLTSAWIERYRAVKTAMGGDRVDYEGRVSYTWHYRSLGEMADEVDAESK